MNYMCDLKLEKYFTEKDFHNLDIIQSKYENLFYRIKYYNDSLINEFDVSLNEDYSNSSLFENMQTLDDSSIDKKCLDNIKTSIKSFNINLDNILKSFINEVYNYLETTYYINIKRPTILSSRNLKMFKSGIIPFLNYRHILEKYLEHIFMSISDFTSLSETGVKHYMIKFRTISNSFTSTTYEKDDFLIKDSYSHRITFDIRTTIIKFLKKEFNKILTVYEGGEIYEEGYYLEVFLNDYLNQDENPIINDKDFIIINLEDDTNSLKRACLSFKSFEKLKDFMFFLGYKLADDYHFYLNTDNRRSLFN